MKIKFSPVLTVVKYLVLNHILISIAKANILGDGLLYVVNIMSGLLLCTSMKICAKNAVNLLAKRPKNSLIFMQRLFLKDKVVKSNFVSNFPNSIIGFFVFKFKKIQFYLLNFNVQLDPNSIILN